MNKLIESKSEEQLYGKYIVDLKTAMKKENITRTKLSKLTGIKYDIINKYYKELCKQVDLGTLAKISYFLKCNIQDILIYEFDEKNGSEYNEI